MAFKLNKKYSSFYINFYNGDADEFERLKTPLGISYKSEESIKEAIERQKGFDAEAGERPKKYFIERVDFVIYRAGGDLTEDGWPIMATYVDGYKIIKKETFFYPFILMKDEEEIRSFANLVDAELCVAKILTGEGNV